ncbi:MAG: TrbI/VirB10 family protein [Sphingomonadaceae bacterium]|nr:TrbI/VirB10 family protein [Sphingomonadaceae bacterium]
MATSPNDNDALFRRLSRPRPAVTAPDRPWAFVAGVAGIVLVALFMFFSMTRSRTARVVQKPVPMAPPPVVQQPVYMPPPTIVRPPVSYTTPLTTSTPQLSKPVTDAPTPGARLKAPAMVVDLSQNEPPIVVPSGGAPSIAGPANGGEKPTADEAFATRVNASSVQTSVATHLSNTSLIAPQGTIIPAILETGLNSDTPGYVRAVVTRDVRGFDGSTVLIPRGSKLIGEYKSGLAQGVSRAFVIWSRVLTPEGISVDIGSPAVDNQGQGGVAGETNSHFLRRFGGAILLSVLSAGLEAASNSALSNGNSSVIVSSPTQATSAASVALSKDLDIPPTVTVRQGTPIRAFIARDLDFSGVMTATPR